MTVIWKLWCCHLNSYCLIVHSQQQSYQWVSQSVKLPSIMRILCEEKKFHPSKQLNKTALHKFNYPRSSPFFLHKSFVLCRADCWSFEIVYTYYLDGICGGLLGFRVGWSDWLDYQSVIHRKKNTTTKFTYIKGERGSERVIASRRHCQSSVYITVTGSSSTWFA